MGSRLALRRQLPGSARLGGRRRVRRSDVLAVVGGFAAALIVAVAWIPLRSGQPNVEVGLALVVVVAAVGVSGRRAAVVAAAVGAAASFTFFDTKPFDHFTISRPSDVVTAVSLIAVGLITGELAVRVGRQRRNDRSATGDLSRVREAASLLASGEELVVMIGSVAHQLQLQLQLSDCWFAAEAIAGDTLIVERDGTLRRSPPDPIPDPEPSPDPVALSQVLHEVGVGPQIPARAAEANGLDLQELALPVWALGQVVGHFVLQVKPGTALGRDRLLVAVTLADQVGASLAAQAPVPPAPLSPPPLPNLRVIH